MTRGAPLVVLLGLLAGACAAPTVQGASVSAEEHDAEARRATTARDHASHLRMAATLRSQEVAACAPSAEPHGGHVPLLLHGDVVRVEAEYQGVTHWRRALRGASLITKAPAMATPDLARREVACHLARAAAHGWDMPGSDGCPLCVRGATAEIAAAEAGIEVTILSDDAVGAGEILRRSRLLAAGTPPRK